MNAHPVDTMSTPEAAAWLGVSAHRVRELARSGAVERVAPGVLCAASVRAEKERRDSSRVSALSTREAARVLGVGTAYAQRLMREGRLVSAAHGLVTAASVDAFLASRTPGVPVMSLADAARRLNVSEAAATQLAQRGRLERVGAEHHSGMVSVASVDAYEAARVERQQRREERERLEQEREAGPVSEALIVWRRSQANRNRAGRENTGTGELFPRPVVTGSRDTPVPAAQPRLQRHAESFTERVERFTWHEVIDA